MANKLRKSVPIKNLTTFQVSKTLQRLETFNLIFSGKEEDVNDWVCIQIA